MAIGLSVTFSRPCCLRPGDRLYACCLPVGSVQSSWERSLSALSSVVAPDHMWLANVAKTLNFQFQLSLINLNGNGHMQAVTLVLDSAAMGHSVAGLSGDQATSTEEAPCRA